MNFMITLHISLFGVFRNSGASSVTLNVPRGSSIIEVKQLLAAQMQRDYPDFASNALFETAVLANDKRVLHNDEQFLEPCTLAILPPVCGG